MSKELNLGVGLAHEFEITMRKAGWETGDVARVSQDEELCRNILAAVRGHAVIAPLGHVINCDAAPFVPEGWSVVEHKRGGLFAFNSDRIAMLYLSQVQMNGESIGGPELRKELEDKPVMNANVLDFLRKHPCFIPKDWKWKAVSFWGTIYRRSGDILCVRHLYWSGTWWEWGERWLETEAWSANCPAALYARQQ